MAHKRQISTTPSARTHRTIETVGVGSEERQDEQQVELQELRVTPPLAYREQRAVSHGSRKLDRETVRTLVHEVVEMLPIQFPPRYLRPPLH